MANLTTRPVLPIYAIALTWVIFTLVHPLYRVSDYVTVILLSAVVFVAAMGIWPTAEHETFRKKKKQAAPPADDPDAAPTQACIQTQPVQIVPAKPQPKPATLEELIQQKDESIVEMRQLNDSIRDATLSKQITQVDDAAGRIFAHTAEHPETLPQVRTFMGYYMPTTVNLLHTYDHMKEKADKTTNGLRGKIEIMMSTIVIAFHRQLGALTRSERTDLDAEIAVMENLLRREGLADPNRPSKPI